MKKVFENINEVEFSEKTEILCMFSAEKEKIDFVKPVDPSKKNVEGIFLIFNIIFSRLDGRIRRYDERQCAQMFS